MAGYDASRTVTFVWIGQGLIAVVLLWGNADFGQRVRSGDIAIDLLRPVDLQAALLAADLGRAGFALLARFTIPLLVGGTAKTAASGRLWSDCSQSVATRSTPPWPRCARHRRFGGARRLVVDLEQPAATLDGLPGVLGVTVEANGLRQQLAFSAEHTSAAELIAAVLARAAVRDLSSSSPPSKTSSAPSTPPDRSLPPTLTWRHIGVSAARITPMPPYRGAGSWWSASREFRRCGMLRRKGGGRHGPRRRSHGRIR